MARAKVDLPYTRIHEYRIICPTTLAQYRIGSRYMANRIARDDKSGGEGIEFLKNEPFDDGQESGTYTYKVYHFKSRIPGAIRWAIPDSYLHFHEESWNAYPHYVTSAFIPGKEDFFYLHIESQHVAYHVGDEVPDNVVGMKPDELKKRKVFYLDIVGHKPPPEPEEYSLNNWACPEAGVETPLTEANPKDVNLSKLPKWIENYPGELMMAIKVVRFRFQWFGLSSAVHKFVMDKMYPKIFTNTHRQLMHWAKEWYPMSNDDLLAYEAETERLQQEYFTTHNPTADDRPDDGKGPTEVAPDAAAEKKSKKDKKKKKGD
jgi:hypothetical protein